MLNGRIQIEKLSDIRIHRICRSGWMMGYGSHTKTERPPSALAVASLALLQRATREIESALLQLQRPAPWLKPRAHLVKLILELGQGFVSPVEHAPAPLRFLRDLLGKLQHEPQVE